MDPRQISVAISARRMMSMMKRIGPNPETAMLGDVLSGPLSYYSDDELDRALDAAGVLRAYLFTDAPRNAPYRRRMAKLMAHFGIAPELVVKQFWNALRAADKVCQECGNRQRCTNWLDWPASDHAPRVICPNAETFDAIASWQKTLKDRGAGVPNTTRDS